MKLGNRTSIPILMLLLASCSSRKEGTFVDSGNHLVLRKDGQTSKFGLGDSVKGDARTFVNGNDIFIVSKSNSIVKFSQKDNALAWKKSIGSVPLANLTFDSFKKIYFTTIDNKFYILDYETGRIDFMYSNIEEKTIAYCLKPILYKKRNFIVVTFNGGEVIVFDESSKKILKVISPGPFKDMDVTLEGSLLRVNEETMDLDKIRL
ncbi:MAG: PQQ-like beta-propeller repeat protein [Rickettsiales bacterium]|jgi:outer membrane protein assembly factor BamB|nr:PQQ-like beta-propeller repeat protein [Rickettsiales bacterium]